MSKLVPSQCCTATVRVLGCPRPITSTQIIPIVAT